MHGGHFDGLQTGFAAASGTFVVQAPLVQAPPMVVQSLHTPPPTPQVATD
jgi:hypothetical protein